ncbi:MAG: class I SAM-dependent methyltransferase [bacterium]
MNTKSTTPAEVPVTPEWNGLIPSRPADSPVAPIFKLIYRASRRNSAVDCFLSSFLKYRHYLPTVAAEAIIPDFARSEVIIRDLPRGLWATPLVDTLSVVKAAIGFKSKKILEIGSYKGSTAKLLAENTPVETQIWTLDIDPNHGEAYRDSEHKARIHRIIGKVSNELLDDHGPFDLIFVDADHDYDSVFLHSTVAFKQLAPGGVILWHDYQQNNYLHGGCAVPEALHMVVRTFKKDILSIEGTMLGIYTEVPGWDTRTANERSDGADHSDPWKDGKIRRI